ncbi:hypothetical protein [Pseudomonas purpurea]|uniref:hypothetical protein n=1 Tax=Pseudomonas purpurea TaxID=3136737 RepID=UPI003266B088
MTDARHTPDREDDDLLKHVRQHRTAEPPASLDALILATARRETPVPKPGLWQRWLHACQRPRWQVAFASLTGVALMLVMVQRSPEPPQPYEFAPEATRSAPPAAKREAAEMASPPAPSAPAGALSAPAPAAPVASFAQPAQRESISAEYEKKAAEPMADEVHVSKRAAAPLATLDQGLREVLRLREAGQTQAADARLAALHKRFPKEDLEARLEALRTP